MEFTFKPINLNFEFDTADFVNIVFENKFWFCKFIASIKSLASDMENNFIFDEKSEKIFKCLDVIYSPLDLDLKLVSNNLLKYLINNDCCSDYDYIKSKLVAFGDSVVLNSELSIDYDDSQINLQKILKLFNFKFYDMDLSYKEKLINYFDLCHNISSYNAFCLIDICSYFNSEDLDLIFEWCKLNDIFIFNIASEMHVEYNFDKIFIVDKDLCVLK